MVNLLKENDKYSYKHRKKNKQQRDSDPNYTVLHLQYSHYRHLQAQHCSTLYMPCKPVEPVQLYPSDQGDVDGTLQQNNEITSLLL